ncbi:hypothetical protein E3N88_34352 [Mikania micrantha]|uniref:Reverse transcriptase Ty1/copia-type domain-containing protein n=1 Tax=Mikania micrantha TaxID=192012 RepID=A0A5N6LYA0_9ASTR|nr:hypothetical protein E3N88_34352 [Mikania micrantha]
MYAKKVLQLAGMWDCNATKCPMEPKLDLTKDGDGEAVDPTMYRRLIGSLRYLIHSRPDLAYSVGVVSRFMESPKAIRLKAVKQILRYVKGTMDYGLAKQAFGLLLNKIGPEQWAACRWSNSLALAEWWWSKSNEALVDIA